MAPSSYAKNFWSPETDAAVPVVVDHFHSQCKSLETLLQFYKERIAIEEEYARKISNLPRKYKLQDLELPGTTTRDSLATLVEETKQFGSTHSAGAQKITVSVQQPLAEFCGDMKAKNKQYESAMMELVKFRSNCLQKVRHAEAKYESLWKRINSIKTEQILMDDTEAAYTQRKVDKLTKQMIEQREKYYRLVKQYSKIQDSFRREWVKYCDNVQQLDEDRTKFIRGNLWEYANALSASCLADDQSAENVRLTLEKCSATNDVATFIRTEGTGEQTGSPYPFIDFAKGATRNNTPAPKQIDIESLIKSTSRKEPTEKQKAAYEMAERGTKTFEELEQRAVSESVKPDQSQQQKQNSEPSTYNSMSECSMSTRETSIASLSLGPELDQPMKSSIKSSLFSNSQLSRSSAGSACSPSRSNRMDTYKKGEDPLRAYLDSLSGSLKSNAKETTNAVGSKKETKEMSRSRFVQRLGSGSSSGSSRISSRTSVTKRRVSSFKRSKSQENLSSKFISGNDLPSHSSEGFPVIKYCRAQFDYKAEIDQELSFEKRDILMILHQQPDGWWFSENLRTGDSGLSPSNYLSDL